ncbi:MAG: thiol:disulfide interchange protein DsbA/DsbL [Rubrivivax sp.]
MFRRQWIVGSAGWALLGLTATASAQGTPVEGRDYVRVAQPVPVPAGKIDVIEFFAYWCPHCNEFEPRLDAWVRKLPSWATFRRMPVAFNASHELTQRLYFALEALGLVDSLHRKAFAAFHLEHRRMVSEPDVAAWARDAGADATRIVEAMKSFSVATKIRQARTLAEGFRIDGVPTLGIHGRYMTSPSIAGSAERALATADALMAQLHKS